MDINYLEFVPSGINDTVNYGKFRAIRMVNHTREAVYNYLEQYMFKDVDFSHSLELEKGPGCAAYTAVPAEL